MKSYSQRLINFCLVLLIAGWASLQLLGISPAWANINEDRLDGNIFVVYAGNGSLVPPKVGLAESLQKQVPAILVYYLDDSQDCKQFAIVVSRLQEFYGRAANLIPISADALPIKASYSADELGYYYQGVVPQTVVLNQTGKVVFNGKGNVKFEAIDDVLREVFGLLPRSKSIKLKRRTVNEFNTELVQ